MRLAAIVFTDIVGFSKLTEGDEVTALELLATLKRMANKPPIDPRVQMNMGLVYAMQGDEEQAVMRGREAMALYPLAKNAINAQRIHIQMVAGEHQGQAARHGDWRVENRCHVGSGEGSRSLQGDRPVSKP